MVIKPRYIAAIGNFDGVHRGHQHLMSETIAFAQSHGAAAAAVTFDPHPRRFFQPEASPFLLTSSDIKKELLCAHGAEDVFTLTFDAALAAHAPEEFMRGVLKDKLGLAGVVAGADFRFGKGRAGGIEALQTIGEEAGLKVRIAEVVADGPDTEKFSSSAVRSAISDGDMKEAAHLLGRAWTVRGTVEEGQKLGRTLGFPTANFTLGDLVEPRRGVYATRAVIDHQSYPAVSNFGRRPTVGADAPLLETHLIDFDRNLYGQRIDIEFVAFLRDERKFEGLDALKTQIATDCERARSVLA
ncbi:MAG: bifunctional riboflavin kinase/FAD synthetase [Pseudomonadota bacterium]